MRTSNASVTLGVVVGVWRLDNTISPGRRTPSTGHIRNDGLVNSLIFRQLRVITKRVAVIVCTIDTVSTGHTEAFLLEAWMLFEEVAGRIGVFVTEFLVELGDCIKPLLTREVVTNHCTRIPPLRTHMIASPIRLPTQEVVLILRQPPGPPFPSRKVSASPGLSLFRAWNRTHPPTAASFFEFDLSQFFEYGSDVIGKPTSVPLA